MNITAEQMHESGTIDLITLLSSIEIIKYELSLMYPEMDRATIYDEYAVLVVDSVYFIVAYNNKFPPHKQPSRYEIFENSECVFRINSDSVDILKSTLSLTKVAEIFTSNGITVGRSRPYSHIDEE